MTWVLAVLIVAAGVTLLVRRAIKGPAYTVETLAGPILGLLRQGYNGGFLIISVEQSQKFVQLNKYIQGPGRIGLELAFPRAAWSVDFYPSLERWCKAKKVPYRISRSGHEDPLEFLFVDLGRDVAYVHGFVSDVFREILGVNDSRLFCRLENATVEDRLIDA